MEALHFSTLEPGVAGWSWYGSMVKTGDAAFHGG